TGPAWPCWAPARDSALRRWAPAAQASGRSVSLPGRPSRYSRMAANTAAAATTVNVITSSTPLIIPCMQRSVRIRPWGGGARPARVQGMAGRSLVIKVMAGKDEAERCGQALNVAATAIASGVTVSLWLAGEAAWFSLPGRADDVKLEHSPAFSDLLASVLASGTVSLCTQCAARRGISGDDVIDGIRISGAATFV